MTPHPPAVPDPAVPDHDLDDLDALLAGIDDAVDRARTLAGDDAVPGSALALTGDAGPDLVKTRLADRHLALVQAQEDLERRRRALRERLQREMDRIGEALEPMRRQVARLQEVVWTVNLYLGRDEQIVTLLDGEPAPAHTPISVRQMVLSMDEETAIAAEGGGMDFRDLDAFDEWITHPDHLRQVLPEPRGVVVLVPRRRGRDYGDELTSSVLNAENRRSYWLIRNGERLFRMSTDYRAVDRLVPAREEFHGFFTEQVFDHTTRTHRTEPLQPGTAAWLRAEQAADARRRHYMRAALILQGLVDRTTVFAPLPADGVSLLRPDSYDAGHVRLICDAENTLPPGRPPFYEWLAERNAALRPGMRIVGAFSSQPFRDLRDRDGGYLGEHRRLHPPRAENPPTDAIHVIEDRRDDGGLVIRYTRTEQVYARDPDTWGGDYRPPRQRASCVLYPDDRFVLPVDLVGVEEMRDYLHARTERHAYLHMLPLLRAAIAAKQAEHDAEAPFRDMLAAQLAQRHDDLDPDQAAAAVDDLVTWWKHTTVHYRPLLAEDPDARRRAVTQILAEYAARRADAAVAARHADRDARVLASLRERVPDAMYVARTRDGGYVVLAPQPRRHPGPLAAPDVYVREYTTGKTARTLTEREWVLVDPARTARWTPLWTSPRWDGWNPRARRADHLTDPEIDTLVQALLDHGAHHRTTRWHDGVPHDQPTGTPAALTCVVDRDRRPRLRLYLAPHDTDPIPDRLLTGTMPRPTARHVDLRWRRGVGNTVVHEADDGSWTTSWEGLHAEDPHATREPWRDEPVLWTDPAVVDAMWRDALAVRGAQRRASELNRTARAARDTVAAAWEARAEQAAYQRFLDDYRRPELWHGHRRTLTGLRFPHHDHAGLDRLIRRLVEDGHDLDGHTVASALAALGEDVTVPADVLDLPLTPKEKS